MAELTPEMKAEVREEARRLSERFFDKHMEREEKRDRRIMTVGLGGVVAAVLAIWGATGWYVQSAADNAVDNVFAKTDTSEIIKAQVSAVADASTRALGEIAKQQGPIADAKQRAKKAEQEAKAAATQAEQARTQVASAVKAANTALAEANTAAKEVRESIRLADDKTALDKLKLFAETVKGLEDEKSEFGKIRKVLEDLTRREIASLLPVGTIIPYASDTPPLGGGDVWLLCDGRKYSRDSHPDLYDAIKQTWGGDEAVKTFNVPDLRGRFLRGVEDPSISKENPPNPSRDTDTEKRIACNPGGKEKNHVGSVQDDAFQGHLHHSYIRGFGGDDECKWGSTYKCAESGVEAMEIVGKPTEHSDYGSVRYGKETRPKNAYVNWYIKAK